MPTRIAYVLDDFRVSTAGTEVQFLRLIRGLDRGLFEPRVFLLRGPDELSSAIPGTPVEVLGIRSVARFATVTVAVRLAIRLRRMNVRLVHLFFNDTSILLPWFFRVAGIKVVVSRRDLGFWYTPGKLRLLRVQAVAVDAVVANCIAVKKNAMQAEGFAAEKVHVIYNGVDERAEARTACGRPVDGQTKPKILAVVANIKPIKRYRDVILALAEIRQRWPDIMLYAIGGDTIDENGESHMAQLQSLICDLGLTGSVVFTGSVPDVSYYVKSADVCLLCSESEGLANALIEYMLAEKPIVATRVGGNEELVGAADCGILVDVGQPAQIADAVCRLLEKNELARQYGSNGRAFATQKLKLSTMLNAYHDVYSSLSSEL